MRSFTLALAAALPFIPTTAWGQASAAASASAASAPAGASALRPSPALRPLPKGEQADELPTLIRAQSILSQPDFVSRADGDVEFRRGGLVVRADHLSYDNATDTAVAQGGVRISRDGAIYSGPEMQLQVQRFYGYFLDTEFEFLQLGAGGRADRVDFIDKSRLRATHAEYTSCKRDGPDEPDWLLRADSVTLDIDASEGVAKGAVLRFLGTPILALPTLSFPLSDARRSGWLPPTLETDNRSGVEIAMPYYWNIAPNRDATLVPRLISRRGPGLDSEFRYLEPDAEGLASVDWLPYDQLTGHARDSVLWRHSGTLGDGVRLRVDAVHVSDDAWWKDFPDAARSLTPRLLPMRASAEKPFGFDGAQGLLYARAEGWQVLQDSDLPVVGPYQRSPQVGVRLGGDLSGWRYDLESEYNHFTLPGGAQAQNGRLGGSRIHLLGDVSYPWREPGWFVVPSLNLNAATYAFPGLQPGTTQHDGRVIPSFSVDTGLEFERQTSLFGRALNQTLEPRLLYVYTPFRSQSQLPNYDSAAKDFNFSSIYSINQFSGVDRVSDGNELTAGVTTRFVDPTTGAEALRLGLVQRYLFTAQHETPQADGTPDGPPITTAVSDLLLLASTTLVPKWTLDSTLEYSPALGRSVQSVVGVRYAPGPFRTFSATYRLTRGLTDQVEIGWQWPVWSKMASHSALPEGGGSGRSGSCSGTWYAVGRINYSMLESRVTDSVAGAEYDAGCWIARVVAERLSTGSSEATTRFMFQLELVGLSRLGSNPLQVLKDNIPGYRLLRDNRGNDSNTDDSPRSPFYD
jgi:LPS-assembly protein